MKLTPLDIHHKEFRRSIRGYDDKEVDDFLDTVADELERLFKENIDLSERIEAAEERVRTYRQMETTINNTLVSAQRSAEDIVASARIEAGTITREAEVKAKEVIHEALTQKQRAVGELARIKQAEGDFRAGFKKTLDEYQAAIREVKMDEDVEAILGGMADEPVVDAERMPAPGTVSFTEPEPVPAADELVSHSDYLIPVEPVEAQEASLDIVVETSGEQAEAAEPDELIADAWATEAMPAVETAPSSGFVTSVHLGETEPPDLPDDLELELPREFTLGSIDTLGEREDDIDIEEID